MSVRCRARHPWGVGGHEIEARWTERFADISPHHRQSIAHLGFEEPSGECRGGNGFIGDVGGDDIAVAMGEQTRDKTGPRSEFERSFASETESPDLGEQDPGIRAGVDPLAADPDLGMDGQRAGAGEHLEAQRDLAVVVDIGSFRLDERGQSSCAADESFAIR